MVMEISTNGTTSTGGISPGAGSTPTNTNVLMEQFQILAKTTKGAGTVELIKQVLDAPGIYTFTEFLEIPSIKSLAGTEHGAFWDLLNIYAYGTFQDYLSKGPGNLPELSPAQTKKLQHLTIVTLAEEGKCIPYDKLQAQLNIPNVRELEDLIIEAVYSEIVQGKLDQRRALFEVDTTIGRDIKQEDLATISSTLESWCDACESVLTTLQSQADRANSERTSRIQKKEQLEQEISNLKKSIKIQSQEVEEAYGAESREALGIEKTPKKLPKKSVRGGKQFKP